MSGKLSKHILRIALAVGTLISLYFVPWILVKAWMLPLPETVQEQLDEAVGHGFEGIIVYVDQAGKPPVSYASGWHNREEKIPANPNALFKLASISKLYTAVSITKMVSAERLSLDGTLTEYLPELEGRIENAATITLRMLVQHRSGIPNYTDTENYWAAPKETYQENLALVLDKPANFKPDQDYEYCNTNYMLLAEIMDRELGYPHFQFIQEEVLDPLELQNTFRHLSEVNIDDVMSGYHVGHPFDLKTDEMGMLATAEDVGVFVRALNDGTLLTHEEQQIYSSIYEYKHSGWVPGYQSFAEYHKDIDAVVVQFNNTTDADLLLWNAAQIVYSRIIKILKAEDKATKAT